MIIIKNPEQIEGIRKSGRLAADALKYVGTQVQPGISTLQLNDLADQYIRDHGGIPAPLNYKNFPKSICTSVNDEICHGVPGDRILASGDIVKVDISTILDGYYADNCYTFEVGKVSKKIKNFVSIAKHCLQLGIAEVKPDAEFGRIGKVISTYARNRGCSVVTKFAGHGVGLELHEAPCISHADSHNPIKMKPGMIFCIEPMINEGSSEALVSEQDGWTAKTQDGKLSAQFEHTVLVTNDGVEILT